MDHLLANLFYNSASLFPDKIAVWCDSKTITYKSLSNLVSQYSNFFLDNGIHYGEHIGIPLNNSIESVAFIFAAANLGITLVPINPTLPIKAIQTVLETADIKHFIARRSFFEQYNKIHDFKIDGKMICLDGEYPDTISISHAKHYSCKRPVISQVTGKEILIITMTSGSTGSPKPISLTQDTKYKRAMAHINLYHITKEDNILAATPLYHSLAERLVIIPLLIGGTSVILPRFTPNLWFHCIKEAKVTFTIAVSAQLSQISSLLSASFTPEISSLRCIVSSSALLKEDIKNELINKLHCDFQEMYGTSETSTITNINFKDSVDKKNSVGKPLSEAFVKIIDENGLDLPAKSIGEIACKTSLLCDGYYKMTEAFKNSFEQDYFKTGDMGFLDENGFLYFSTRKKELIITGGINVYPSDIETCISKLPEIKECAAFAYPNENLGEVVALAVVLKQHTILTKRAIQIYCAKNLADFQQPHKIFFLEKLPKNSMGKLVKTNLLEYVQLYSENK